MDMKKYVIEEILKYARMIQDCMPRGKTIYFVPVEIEYKTKQSRRKEETEQDE